MHIYYLYRVHISEDKQIYYLYISRISSSNGLVHLVLAFALQAGINSLSNRASYPESLEMFADTSKFQLHKLLWKPEKYSLPGNYLTAPVMHFPGSKI